MTQRFPRRKFLKGTAAAAGVALGSKVFGAPALLAERSPNSKLNTVVIGCANQGLEYGELRQRPPDGNRIPGRIRQRFA